MSSNETRPAAGSLSVWWLRGYSDFGQYTAHIPVVSPEEALRAIEILAESEMDDEHIVYNANGLEVFDGTEWSEWSNEDGEDIDEYEARLEDERAENE